MKLSLEPNGLLGKRYQLNGPGGVVGSLSFGWCTYRAIAKLGPRRLELSQSLLTSRISIAEAGRPLCHSQREGLFTRSHRVHFAGKNYRLETSGLFSVNYRLFRGLRSVALVQRMGFWRTGWQGNFDGDLSPDLCAFVLFLLAALRQDAAMVASG